MCYEVIYRVRQKEKCTRSKQHRVEMEVWSKTLIIGRKQNKMLQLCLHIYDLGNGRLVIDR